jgi:hypothetical protein
MDVFAILFGELGFVRLGDTFSFIVICAGIFGSIWHFAVDALCGLGLNRLTGSDL